MAQPLLAQSTDGSYSTDNCIITTTTSSQGIGATSSTASANLLINGTGGDFIIGDCIATTGCITGGATGIISTGGYYNTSFNNLFIDRSTIQGKDGDVLMDLKNMKFKIYSDIDGWIEYNMEDFSTKNKRVELNGSKETSVSETITTRSTRTVLFEKISKLQYLTTSSGSFSHVEGNNTLTIPYYDNTFGTYVDNENYNLVGTTGGYNNVAIGVSSVTPRSYSCASGGRSTTTGSITIPHTAYSTQALSINTTYNA